MAEPGPGTFVAKADSKFFLSPRTRGERIEVRGVAPHLLTIRHPFGGWPTPSPRPSPPPGFGMGRGGKGGHTRRALKRPGRP